MAVAVNASELKESAKDDQNDIFGLHFDEIWWRDRYDVLFRQGYQLRPRYRPGWTPSWTLQRKRPQFTEDGQPTRHSKTIDAVRVSDGKRVMIKKVDRGSEEVEIAQFFSSEELAKDLRNHCVPVLDLFNADEDDLDLMVMPLLLKFWKPEFSSVDEALDFMKQLIEGLSFMHEHDVAHRDCSDLNIMMDGECLYPKGFHPSKPILDASGEKFAHPRRRRNMAVKYYFTDFGISTRFNGTETTRLVVGANGQDDEVPELSLFEPYDPFAVDVFILGNVFRRNFIDKYENLDFLDPLIQKMTLKEPKDRPTSSEALQVFNEIVHNQHPRCLRWALIHRRASTFQRFIWDVSSVAHEAAVLVKSLLPNSIRNPVEATDWGALALWLGVYVVLDEDLKTNTSRAKKNIPRTNRDMPGIDAVKDLGCVYNSPTLQTLQAYIPRFHCEMSDLVSLVLGIPGIVEGFVKTCRAIEAYENVDRKHRQTIADAIHYSKKLNYYSNFVDQRPDKKDSDVVPCPDAGDSSPVDDVHVEVGDQAAILEESQELLSELFRNSLVALNMAADVVDEWTVRLKLNIDENDHHKLYTKRIALRITDYLTRKIRSSSQRKEGTMFTNFYGKTAFLVIGSQQVEDAMSRLKHWLDELHDILIVSPALRRVSDLTRETRRIDKVSDEDVLFVSMAKERERRQQTMETVKPEWISSLRPLDDRKPQSFMLVEEKGSPFHGCLVDRRNVAHILDSGNEKQALRNTELIARLFAEERDELGHDISASVGVLPCCGFSRPIPGFHNLVFRLPENSRRPRTLRSLLLQHSPLHSLDERLAFCIKLASAVLIIHSLGIVHKDIRPDSIVVIDRATTLSEPADRLQTIGDPYVVGFNASRSMDTETIPLQDQTQYDEFRWAELYTHPRKLASNIHLPSEMRDDIYGLGICLLEISMWTSLFVWDPKSKIYVNDTSVCDLSETKYDKMLMEMGEDVSSSDWLRQHDLVILAEQKVPVTMGNAFKEVVVECLTFGMGKRSLAEVIEGKDLGRARIKNQGTTFIRNILSKLRSLKLS